MATEKTVSVKLKGDISDFQRAILEASAGTKGFVRDLDSADGRMGNLVQTSLALGPALVPIGAAAVPAIAGLTNQLAFAGVAAGVAVLAFQGVGTALKAVNDYSIDPTAANLKKMQESLATLGPEGQRFVVTLQQLRPELQKLQTISQAGLFPGADSALNDLMNLMPQAERIVGTTAKAIGDLLAEAGANLDSPKWHEFFDFIDKEARPTLIEMGRTVGNFAEGFANLWMAFAPLSNNFSHSFLDLARDFAEWTDGLDKTKGFQEFVDYINRVGPKAWDTLGALGNALLQIVEAAAPVGEATLPAITALSNVIATLADSDLGPLVIGVVSLTAALSRMKALATSANSSSISNIFAGPGKITSSLKSGTKEWLNYDVAAGRAMGTVGRTTPAFRSLASSVGKAGAGIGLLSIVMSGLDTKMGLTATSTGALAGLLVTGGPWGAAIGGAIGLIQDFSHQNDEAKNSVDRASQAIDGNVLSLEAQKKLLDQARLSSAVLQSIGDNSQVDKVKALNDQYDKNVRAAQEAKFAEVGLSSAMRGVSQSTRDQTEALIDNATKHNTLANSLLGDRGAMRNFEQSIDDATKALKENGRTLDIGTPKGRANQAALDGIAASYNQLSDDQKRNQKVTDEAKSAYIRIAVAMDGSKRSADESRKAAKKLADALFALPAETSLKITAETAAALNKLRGIQEYINGMHGKTVKIKVENGTPGGILKNADGGLIRGPGGPRDDLIPSYLSNGEFVMNAAATARFLPQLHAMNAQKFADGGPVISPLSRPQRMVSQFADGGFSGLNASLSLSASIVGARVAVDKDGIASFVDGRIELVTAGDNNYRNSKKR